MDGQLLRIVLPTELLREVDQLLLEEGSSRSRTDFVREAVEQRVVEIRYGDEARLHAQTESSVPARLAQSHSTGEDDDPFEHPLLRPRSLADTRLPPPGAATVAHPDAATKPVEPGPMFLHGRDYPSLWCLWWLSLWADEAPLELGAYLQDVTRAAWTFAERLSEFDRPGALKPATMFPTSSRNPDSATQTFQAAAVGGLIHRRDGSQVVVGPLALWGVAQIYPWRDRVVIAPTAAGLQLLESLEGLSLELPHRAQHAEVFLEHLEANAPSDYRVLARLLEILRGEPTRQEVIGQLEALQVVDSKLADVYAQAYVARGREWGLVEPKLVARRYRLTELGRSVLSL